MLWGRSIKLNTKWKTCSFQLQRPVLSMFHQQYYHNIRSIPTAVTHSNIVSPFTVSYHKSQKIRQTGASLYYPLIWLFSNGYTNTSNTKNTENQHMEFDEWIDKFAPYVANKYDIKLNDELDKLSHEHAEEITKVIRIFKTDDRLKDEQNEVCVDCALFTERMLWFIMDIVISMNVGLYRADCLKKNQDNIAINAAEFLKDINGVYNDPEPNETLISITKYYAMNHMNICWHSYFKKNGDICHIEDSVDTMLKHSKLLYTTCLFMHIWTLYNSLNDIFVDKLFNDKYPNILIKNADELRAYLKLIICDESEQYMRQRIEEYWSKLVCDKECEEEYDGTDYFDLERYYWKKNTGEPLQKPL